MAYRICFPEQHRVAVEEFDPGDPGPGQVRLRALASQISNGTESILLHRRFAPGTHWDSWFASKGGYPWLPGYAMVGEVLAVGPGVALKAGQRLACRSSHASETIVDATGCHAVDAGLDPRAAAWFALAKITCMGGLAAGAVLGEPVVVIGAGPIGQLAVRWLRAAGAQPLLLVDPVEARLAHARHLGIATCCGDVASQVAAVRERTGGGGAVVVDATGNAAVFPHALAMARDRGTVVLLGDTGTPGEQRLTGDVVLRGLRIVGAHDSHASGAWSERRILDLFASMVSQGRFDMTGLTTHVVPARRAAEAYAAIDRDPSGTMGVILDWQEI